MPAAGRSAVISKAPLESCERQGGLHVLGVGGSGGYTSDTPDFQRVRESGFYVKGLIYLFMLAVDGDA